MRGVGRLTHKRYMGREKRGVMLTSQAGLFPVSCQRITTWAETGKRTRWEADRSGGRPSRRDEIRVHQEDEGHCSPARNILHVHI